MYVVFAVTGTGEGKVQIVRNLIETHKPSTRQELVDLMAGHDGIPEGTLQKARQMLSLE